MKAIKYLFCAAMLALFLSACASNQPSVFSTSTSASPDSDISRVPWDYRVVEGKVGDIIGSDMTILPDNTLVPNDGNYATGDAVWTLQYMDAEMTTDANNRNQIQLSSWNTLKSYKDQKSAQADLSNLKISLESEVDLVGVYKTTNQGKTRNFAVLTLPSGNRIKQPISDERYTALEKQKKVKVLLEEVHDFGDYDSVYAKFRGWAK
ncbi:signal peptide protein [Paenibacillus solisilvae]|uniref:Signal peptide protein n=1 Tax=Paenibacillus solisilvae TaxID=2486751 RepID=A0ABW0VV52_9BACL